MSVSNFVPTVWSARVQANLDKALVIGQRANRAYEGDARSGTVKINKVGDVAVTSHAKDGTVTYGVPYSTQQTLTLDQREIAAFKVDDLDAIQANINLVEQYSRRMGYSLADAIDWFIAGKYTSAGAGDVTLDITSITASEVRNAFADAAANLDMNNIPREGRWALLSPLFLAAMMKDTGISQATERGDAILASGAIGRFMGFDLFQTNGLQGTGVTVKLAADAAAGATSLTIDALTGTVPAGTILRFGAGKYARVTAQGDVSDTTLSVAKLTVPIANDAEATYIKVRKALYGTNDAITFAMNQFPSVEALRDIDTTDDYIRAQQNYGALVLEPYALGTFSVTEAS